MKRSLGLVSLAVTLWSSLGWGLTCKGNEYPYSNKCCKYCPPGEELVKRCTDSSPTECKPCDENYYNDVYTYSRCKPCTDCEADQRLEITPCRRTSDTACYSIHTPTGSQENGCTTTQPTPFPKETGVFTTNLGVSPSVVPTNPGFVWILIAAVLLLTVAGILVFRFFCCVRKKKKLDILCAEIYADPCKYKENDYRLPIQEQEVGVKSDFVQG